eukprot:Hpha_TRINITY_DN9938_c0_g1::TRINITY_DN9938_c0_g1_i1::g.140602::m.140602
MAGAAHSPVARELAEGLQEAAEMARGLLARREQRTADQRLMAERIIGLEAHMTSLLRESHGIRPPPQLGPLAVGSNFVEPGGGLPTPRSGAGVLPPAPPVALAGPPSMASMARMAAQEAEWGELQRMQSFFQQYRGAGLSNPPSAPAGSVGGGSPQRSVAPGSPRRSARWGDAPGVRPTQAVAPPAPAVPLPLPVAPLPVAPLAVPAAPAAPPWHLPPQPFAAAALPPHLVPPPHPSSTHSQPPSTPPHRTPPLHQTAVQGGPASPLPGLRAAVAQIQAAARAAAAPPVPVVPSAPPWLESRFSPPRDRPWPEATAVNSPALLSVAELAASRLGVGPSGASRPQPAGESLFAHLGGDASGLAQSPPYPDPDPRSRFDNRQYGQ